jgi:hypothetical protein
MPRLTLEVTHALGLDEALARLKKKLAAAMAEHQSRLSDFSEEWRDNTLLFAFRAMGMAVNGSVAVEPQLVRVDAQLPMAAAFFKGAIEDRLRHEVGQVLSSP